jgi:hypothetical protein
MPGALVCQEPAHDFHATLGVTVHEGMTQFRIPQYLCAVSFCRVKQCPACLRFDDPITGTGHDQELLRITG